MAQTSRSIDNAGPRPDSLRIFRGGVAPLLRLTCRTLLHAAMYAAVLLSLVGFRWCLERWGTVKVYYVSCPLKARLEGLCTELPESLRTSGHIDAFNMERLLFSKMSKNFTLYFGHKGVCGSAMEVAQLASSSLVDAMGACLLNQNCTFVTHSWVSGEVRLCSGRTGTEVDGRIKVTSHSYQSGWISADRKGCQNFAYDQAVFLHKNRMLPTCYHDEHDCSIAGRHKGNCLWSLLTFHSSSGYVVTQSGKYLCQHPHFGLVLYPQYGQELESSSKDLWCNWVQSQAVSTGGFNYVNTESEDLLLHELVDVRPDGSLQIAGRCICQKDGMLFMGRSCRDNMCKWSPAHASMPGCYFTSRIGDTCLTSLLHIQNGSAPVSTENVNNCLCMDGQKRLWTDSSSCSSSRCIWVLKEGKVFNQQYGLRLDNAVAFSRDSTLVPAHEPRMCVCDNTQKGFVVGPWCGNADCVWNTEGVVVRTSGVAEAQQFDVFPNSVHTCAIQLEPVLLTATLQEAMQLCLEQPLCTYVAFNARRSTTLLCSGHFEQEDGADSELWYSAFRKGCHSHTQSRAWIQAAEQMNPTCHQAPLCDCPPATFLVQPCTDTTKAICDVCITGYCPVWPDLKPVPRFVDPVQDLAQHIQRDSKSKAPFHMVGSSFLEHPDGQVYLVFNLANKTRPEEFTTTITSHRVGICAVHKQTYIPVSRTCFELPVKLNVTTRQVKAHPTLDGVHDVRAVTVGKEMYLLGTIHLQKNVSSNTGTTFLVTAILQLSLDLRSVVRVTVLRTEAHPQLMNQKNYMPLALDGRLLLISTVTPLSVVVPNLTTGSMEVLARSWLDPPHLEAQPHLQHVVRNSFLRGQAAFVKVSQDQFLGAVRHSMEYQYGLIYTQHLVVLRAASTGFALTWVSDGFRLPDVDDKMNADIQRITGLRLDGSKLIITYSASEMRAGLAFVENIQGVLDGATSGRLVNVIPDTAAEVPAVPILRWESPLSDMSSLALAARKLAVRLSRDYGDAFSLQMHDTASHADMDIRQSLQKHLGKYIVRSNKKLNAVPSVTIQMSELPPPSTPVSSAKVVFLTWKYYHLPDDWASRLQISASEVWVTSTYAREGLVNSGVAPSKVKVIPIGVDASEVCLPLSTHTPLATTLNLNFGHKFVFLFRGSATWDDGVDLLLRAFAQEFRADEPVLLLLHITHGDPEVYDWMNDMIMQVQHVAEIRLLTQELSTEELKLVYGAAMAYVHPARASNLALAVAEAMACGLPVIVPNKGGHLDFVDQHTGFLVPSKTTPCQLPPCEQVESNHTTVYRVRDMEMSRAPMYVEINERQLAAAMRLASTNRDLSAMKAAAAHAHARNHLGWDVGAEVIAYQLDTLLLPSSQMADVDVTEGSS